MRTGRDFRELQKLLITKLKVEGVIRSPEVEEAMTDIPREAFIPGASPKEAYGDRPQFIGNGQTISAPHMVAIMVEALDLRRGQKVLEIGGGSGYHAAVISKVIGPEGKVFSLEIVPSLAERARNALASVGLENVSMITGDGSEGYQSGGPYDRIYYTCAAPYVPEEVLSQLKDDGFLLSVEGEPNSTQRLIGYRRDRKGTFRKKILTYCIFVPLVGKRGHRS